MPIADLCSNKLISIDRKATLQQAAQMMKDHHVGGIVVVEANGQGKPVGILTDRDIVLNVVAENLPINTPVQEVMSKNIVKVAKWDGIAEVVEQMESSGVRRMIVVDESGRACGLVSADDILQLVSQELSGLGSLISKQVENEEIRLRA